MATLTNKSLHTASLTNKGLMTAAQQETFDQTSPHTFDQMQGTFSLPYAIANKAIHTGSMTNKSASA